jgi:hypothetical protein
MSGKRQNKGSMEKVLDSPAAAQSNGVNSEPLDFRALTAEEERKLWRKIDLRLMPILSLMYLASFIDRCVYLLF